MPYLRQSHNVKPVRWGSEADVQYAIAKNSEKIYGVDPDSNVLTMPLFFGFPCLDFSGKQNHGTPYGGVAYHSGSLDFDGTDDYVGVGSGVPTSLKMGTGSFTVSAWVTIDAYTTTGGRIVAVGTNVKRYELRETLTVTDKRIYLTIDDDTTKTDLFLTASNLDDSNRHYIVGVRDRASDLLRIYIDGIQKVSGADNTNNSIDEDTAACIGRLSEADAFFDGLIADTRINNIALTVEQIALFYARKWDLYRRVGRTYYSVAAASGFQPAWARNSNIILQPGVYS